MFDLTLTCPTCGRRADVCFEHGDDWKKRPSKLTCPECKGERGYHGPVECAAMYEHEGMEDCGCPRSWTPCQVCNETGEVDRITLAVYNARGGAAPVQRKGFA